MACPLCKLYRLVSVRELPVHGIELRGQFLANTLPSTCVCHKLLMKCIIEWNSDLQDICCKCEVSLVCNIGVCVVDCGVHEGDVV